METHDALDVATLILTVLLTIFLCVLGGYVVSYRELEFNRMWRTRLFLVFLVLLFTLALCLSTVHWFPDRFATAHGRAIACGIATWACQCLFLPLFLAIVVGLINSLADSSALLSAHPNRGVLSRAFKYCTPVLLLGLVNVILPVFGVDIAFFATYGREDGYCDASSYVAILLTLFYVLIFIRVIAVTGLCRGEDATRPRLNVIHMRRIKRLCLNVIPFIILECISIMFPYVSRPIHIVFRYIVFIGLIACLVVYLYHFIMAPLREASVVILRRGDLTMRHGRFMRRFSHRDSPSDGDELVHETDEFRMEMCE
jgi:energy-converting hydrogenase Eha subunit A